MVAAPDRAQRCRTRQSKGACERSCAVRDSRGGAQSSLNEREAQHDLRTRLYVLHAAQLFSHLAQRAAVRRGAAGRRRAAGGGAERLRRDVVQPQALPEQALRLTHRRRVRAAAARHVRQAEPGLRVERGVGAEEVIREEEEEVGADEAGADELVWAEGGVWGRAEGGRA